MQLLNTLSIAGILALAACSTTETKVTKLSNSDLEQMVKARLAADPQLAKSIDVSADADKNEVTLKGDVPTEQLRSQAIDLAKSSKEGLVITDKIDVKPLEVSRSEFTEDMARDVREKAKATGDKIGDTLDDAWIHGKIMAKLVGNSETPARKIKIDVVNHIVTLRGEVNTVRAKAEAERTARDTEGVKRVRNLLRVVAG